VPAYTLLAGHIQRLSESNSSVIKLDALSENVSKQRRFLIGRHSDSANASHWPKMSIATNCHRPKPADLVLGPKFSTKRSNKQKPGLGQSGGKPDYSISVPPPP
jgi:hypothetical protein